MSEASTTSPEPGPAPGAPGGAGTGADGPRAGPADDFWRPPKPAHRAPVVRADLAFMRQKLSRCIALGLGAGLAPIAPGTIGTLWGWAAWRVMTLWWTPEALLLVVAVGFAVGVWACGRTARALGVPDHGSIVWDEIVAFWLVLAMLPDTLFAQLGAFVLFRCFDIVKPPPIRHFDATIEGGFGIMFDDLLAAFYTLLVFAAWKAWA